MKKKTPPRELRQVMIDPLPMGDMAELINEIQIGTEPSEVDPSKVYTHHVDGATEVLDLEEYLPAPRRRGGNVQFRDAESLVEYVVTQDVPKPMLYANLETFTLVVILNDHVKNSPGWKDFRAVLQAKMTREWKFWSLFDGKLIGQVAFAEHIEQGVREIVDPPAADMLELAMKFEAETHVAFKSGTTLTDGSRTLQYISTIEAKAGQAGNLSIPKEFELALAPFEGSSPFNIKARLRYRIEQEALKIGYQLDRPAALLEEAFQSFVQKAATMLSRPVMWGTPE